MSNRITKPFVPAKPTPRIGTNLLPEKEKLAPTKLANIVPKRFVKAVPPRSRFLNSDSNPDLSSSSGTTQEESATDSEERSATIENEASSFSGSEQSTEKIQSNATAEQNTHRITGQSSSISGGQIPLKTTPWMKITSDQRELNALRVKRRAENRELKRQKVQSLPQKHKSKLEFPSNSESPSDATEFVHSFVLPTNSSQHDLSQRPKKTIMDFIPERWIKTPLEILQKSALYKDAKKGDKHMASLRPLALEKYLSSLLKDTVVAETIEKYKVPADAVVAIKWYGQDGFPYVQQSLRGKPDPTLGQDNVVAPPETFKNLVKACERGFAKLPPLSKPGHKGFEVHRGFHVMAKKRAAVRPLFSQPFQESY
jgi:hypothetical protein